MEQGNNISNNLQKNPSEGDRLPTTQGKKENFFKEIIKFALLAVVIVLPIRLFIAQPFIVSGGSMDPTFADKQYLIVDQISYRFEDPQRGDVIIFRYPLNIKKFFIKRIIGLPSETIEVRGSKVAVTDKETEKIFTLNEPYIDSRKSRNDQVSITLKDDEYFVMGDNRTESNDSRIWGPLKHSLIIGRPFVRLFPIGKISFLPGAYVPDMAEITSSSEAFKI